MMEVRVSGDQTMGGIKYPEVRLRKLNERRQHIEDTIAELKDRHYIIESEIAELRSQHKERER